LVLQIAPGGQTPGVPILWDAADAHVTKIALPTRISVLVTGILLYRVMAASKKKLGSFGLMVPKILRRGGLTSSGMSISKRKVARSSSLAREQPAH
jgi:hypothetical protein